jgi:hypothetical protein
MLLSSCSSPRETVVRDGDTVALAGVITPAVAKRFTRLLDPSVKTLVIDSVGGDEASALVIAHAILEAQADVVVDGVCLSACAHYIFVAGARKSIRPASLVACHHNTIAMTEFAEREYGRPFSTAELARRMSALELYRKAGASTDFARVCMAAVVPLCVCLDPSKDNQKSVVYVWDEWIPLGEDFERFGIANVSGAPVTRGDALLLAAQRGFDWATAEAVSIETANTSLSMTENCATTNIECKATPRPQISRSP